MDAQPGEWYYGFRCEKCNRLFPVIRDESNGQNPVKFAGPGKLAAHCTHAGCGHLSTCAPEQFELMQVHAKA